jgi:hypothetical protein
MDDDVFDFHRGFYLCFARIIKTDARLFQPRRLCTKQYRQKKWHDFFHNIGVYKQGTCNRGNVGCLLRTHYEHVFCS